MSIHLCADPISLMPQGSPRGDGSHREASMQPCKIPPQLHPAFQTAGRKISLFPFLSFIMRSPPLPSCIRPLNHFQYLAVL